MNRPNDNITIAVLENDFQRMTEVIRKIEVTLEKLGEISQDISEMLAVHKEKFSASESISTANTSRITKIEERIRTLENWRWFVIGISAIAGIFARNITDAIFK